MRACVRAFVRACVPLFPAAVQLVGSRESRARRRLLAVTDSTVGPVSDRTDASEHQPRARRATHGTAGRVRYQCHAALFGTAHSWRVAYERVCPSYRRPLIALSFVGTETIACRRCVSLVNVSTASASSGRVLYR